jgi:predicted permease
METLIQDLRFSFRLIYKNLKFTTMILLVISLGSGSVSAVFSLMDAMLINPLAHRITTGDRLVVIWETNLSKGLTEWSSSVPNYLDYQQSARSFEELTAAIDRFFTMTGGEYPERIWGGYTSANYFTVLGAKPMMGRTYLPEENQAGRDRVIVISHRLWEKRFGSDQNIVGKKVQVDGAEHEIIGVMPQGFDFPPGNLNVEIWKPIVFSDSMRVERGSHSLDIYGLLKPGVTADEANAEMSVIARRLEQQHPITNEGVGARVLTVRDQMAKPAKLILWVLMGTVCFLLLIVCANISNFLLVRSVSRRKEFAIRIAVGMGKWRLVRQLLTESLTLALIGCGVGIILGVWGVKALIAITPDWILNSTPRMVDMGLNWRMVSITVMVTLLTGIIYGLAPAIYGSRSDINPILKGSGKSDTSPRAHRLGNLLIVVEVAITLILMVGAGLMVKSFTQLITVPLGFDPKNVITMKISLPESRYQGSSKIADFYSRLLGQIKAMPQVKSVGVANLVPLEPGSSRTGIDGVPQQNPDTGPTVNYRVTSPDYFTAMRIPIMAGRSFTEHDIVGSQPVMIINEALARRYFPNEQPLGKQLRVVREEIVREIVGIVRDAKQAGVGRNTAPEIYVPMVQSPRSDMTLVIRTDSDLTSLISSVRNQVRNIDPAQPIFNINLMDRVIEESVYPQRFFMLIITILATLALVFSTLGLYTIVSYSVAQRNSEFGIRMAMGARPGDVLKLVLRQGAVPALIGSTLGLIGAFFLSSILSGLLYEVKAQDVITFVATSLLLVMISIVATLIPALRAARLDPVAVLRHE